MSGFSFIAVPSASGSNGAGSAGQEFISASFRDWVSKVHNCFITGGFGISFVSGTTASYPIMFGSNPNTAITQSQIPIPTGSSHYPGFVVYKFTDAISVTNPLYVLVEFGQANGANGYPAMRISLGTQSATGSPVGGTMPGGAREFVWSVSSGGTQRRHLWYIGADGTGSDAYMSIIGPVMDIDNIGYTNLAGNKWIVDPIAGNTCLCIIERTKGLTGAANNHGFVYYGRSLGATFLHTAMYSGSVSRTIGNGILSELLPNIDPSSVDGMPLLSAMGVERGDSRNYLTGLIASKDSSITPFSMLSLSLYTGISHKYIKIPTMTALYNDTTTVPLVRWD